MTEPNWGNTHAPNCLISQHRPGIWTDFCEKLAVKGEPGTVEFTRSMAMRDEAWGIVIEFTAGGDEDREGCTCETWNKAVHMTREERERLNDLLALYMTNLMQAEIVSPIITSNVEAANHVFAMNSAILNHTPKDD